MKEGTCRFNTSLCTLLKFWEAVGGPAEKQVTGCERAQQFSGAEYKHENFPLNGDLSEANTLRDFILPSLCFSLGGPTALQCHLPVPAAWERVLHSCAYSHPPQWSTAGPVLPQSTAGTLFG